MTGKADAHEWLRTLGATEVIDRSALSDTSRPLQKEGLGRRCRQRRRRSSGPRLELTPLPSSGRASGNTAGVALLTTVLPFILVRGVALLGIDSVRLPIDRRRVVWRRLGDDLLPPAVDQLASTEVGLDALPEALSRVLAGDPRGRTLVRID